MGLFDKIKEPIFLKDSTKDEQIVEDLERLADSADEDGKKQIKQEIKKIKYGIIGEKKIEFELKNSHAFWGCSRFPKCRFVQNLTDKDDAS